MEDLFANHTADSSELFREHVRGIIAELGNELPDEEGLLPHERAWLWLQGHSVFARKGTRSNLNRFHSVARDGFALLRRWTAYSCQLEYVCLELDFFKGTKFAQRVTAEAHQGVQSTASTGGLGVDEKAMRGISQNAVVISAVFLADGLNMRALALFAHLSMPVS